MNGARRGGRRMFDKAGIAHLESLGAGQIVEIIHVEPVAGYVEDLHALLLLEKMLEEVIEAQLPEIGATG